MALREAYSIDQLYSRVAECDIALTAEAPLALALDNRVQTPRIGRLSATPRSYAVGEMFPEDIRSLFFAVLRDTELSWKRAVRALQLCIECWTMTGERDGILEYPEFDTAGMRAVVSVLGEVASSYRAVEQMTISVEQDVAVIDAGQLSALDRELLPPRGEFETYSSLGSESVSFPAVQVFPSATAIVSTILDQIDAESADQFGVVLAEGSLYSALLESGLEARGIPYRGGPGFEDDRDVRAFLRLVETTFAGSDQRVAEIRPVLTAAGIDVSQTMDERRVDTLNSAELGSYVSFRECVADGTFRDAVASYESIADARLAELRRELDALGLLDARVTEERVARFAYYLDAFTVPTDAGSTEDGVLLAGATSTAYVDRPVVFYVGLGPEWAQSPPEYPWIDEAAFVERDVERFERLLQNGEQRYYFVQETRAGSEIAPCVYLRRVLDESFESFSDLPHTRYAGPPSAESVSPFPGPSESASSRRRVETLSQSRLKALANAPRDVYFDRLVEASASLPMVRGTVLHEAAEIYVAAPSVIEDERERVLDAMCERLAPYLGDAKRAVQRSMLGIGLDAITAYVDANPPAEDAYESYDVRARENELAAALGVACESRVTERWFESPRIGLHGYVDLLQDATTVVDYKTGSKDGASELLDAASVDPVAEYPNFQALAYLAKHREERPGERVEIRFVYLLHESDAAVAGDPPEPAELVTTITYVPATFSEFVASRETFETLTDYADSNNRCKVLQPLGFEAYREFFERHELPRAGEDKDENEERRAEITERFVAYAQARVGEYKYVRRGCEAIIEDLDSVPEGYVLEAEVDAFEAFVEEQLAAVNEYRQTRFPVAYRDDGPTWDRVEHRDLILTDR